MSDVRVQIVNAVKCPRKPNFSTAECTTILEIAEENIDIIREKFSSVLTNKKKAEVWRNIVSKVNAHGVTVGTVSGVKDKWRAMVMGTKKDFSREKRERRKTGGGKEPAAATQRSEKIIQMFGDEPSFSGIPGGIESGTPYGNFCSLSSFLRA